MDKSFLTGSRLCPISSTIIATFGDPWKILPEDDPGLSGAFPPRGERSKERLFVSRSDRLFPDGGVVRREETDTLRSQSCRRSL